MPLQLHLHSLPPGRFSWLSAPGTAALSVLFIEGVDFVATPRRVWLVGAGGERIDEAMACDHRNGLLVTCHGGPAVRRAVESALACAGFKQSVTQPFGATRFERLTLALLPQAQGAAAVTMTLEAACQSGALAELPADDAAGLLADSASAPFLFNPPRVQLWGPVNAGKSSLLNALCGQSLAAVGDEPGLTRDVIEGRLEHEGFVIRLFDAPGTWDGGSSLDAAAQALASHWRDQADLVLKLPREHARVAVLVDRKLAYDVQDAASVGALKAGLVEHFFGPLRRLPPARRFVLHPELRADLGKLPAEVVKEKWLG